MASELRAGFRVFVAAIALSSVALSACSGSDGSYTEERFPAFTGDCTTVKRVPTFGDLEQGILTICRGCHSTQKMGAARNNAPPAINFDTYELFSAESDNAVLLVQNLLMPPPKGVGPTDSERNQLYAWAACGKPR